MIVAGGQTPPPPPLALMATATQSLTSGSDRRRSLPRRHLEGSPPSVVIVVITVAIIVNVIAIVVSVDVPRPLPFHRPNLIVDCVHRDTIAPLLPPSAFVVILAPLLLLPSVVGRPCGRSPLFARRRGRAPRRETSQLLPPCWDLFLGGGSDDSNWHVEGGFNKKNTTINCVFAP